MVSSGIQGNLCSLCLLTTDPQPLAPPWIPLRYLQKSIVHYHFLGDPRFIYTPAYKTSPCDCLSLGSEADHEVVIQLQTVDEEWYSCTQQTVVEE